MIRRSLFPLLLALLPLAAGCGGQAIQAKTSYEDPHPLPPDTLVFAAPEIGAYGGRFVIGQTNPPKTFNSIMANETSSTDITDRLFVGLTAFDNARQVIYPLIAKSYEVTPDGKTWTWHLRQGARFSDGEPITSADVAFSLEVAMDKELHPAVQDLLIVGGRPLEVSTPDPMTVVTTAAAPYAILDAVISSVRIMPKHRLEAAYKAGDFASTYGVNTAPESLVTSGAWRVKQYVPGEKTVIERNPYWFGVDAKGQRLPYLDELVYLIVPDQNTAALKFQAGDLDALDNVKPEDYSTYTSGAERGNYTLYDLGPALNTNFFWFNLNRVREPKPGRTVGETYVRPAQYAQFKERDFRRAVSKAVDRDAIIRGPFYGNAVKNWSTTTPGNSVWHTPDITHDDYDPEGAKRLLAGLGWRDKDGDGFLEDGQGNTVSFTLKSNGDNAIRVAMMNFIKDDLAKVGIRCVPTPVDFNTLITNFRQDFSYEAALLGLQSGVPPDPALGQNVHRSSGLTHYWNIKQPRPETEAEARIDRHIDALLATSDLAVRKQHWREIQNLVNGECFVVWLPTLVAKVPVRNRFGNVRPSVIPHRILWNIEQVYRAGRPA